MDCIFTDDNSLFGMPREIALCELLSGTHITVIVENLNTDFQQLIVERIRRFEISSPFFPE